MGSLGAGRVSEYLKKELKRFSSKDYEILFITGKGSYDKVMDNKYPSNVKIIPFYEGLPSLMKITDLMVTRAGASTLSEIIALGVPSIIIPSPFVANNHQYINALDLVNKNAAIMIEEKNLEDGVLSKKIDDVIFDEEKLLSMKNNLSKLMVKDSADVIYNNLKRIINEKDK